MTTAKLPLRGEPKALKAHVTLEGNKIIIDRSEFPIRQYPAITNAQLMKDVTRMIEQEPERFEREG